MQRHDAALRTSTKSTSFPPEEAVKAPTASEVKEARALLVSALGPRLLEAMLQDESSEVLSRGAAALPSFPRLLPPEAFGVTAVGLR